MNRRERKGAEKVPENLLSRQIIGAAIDVHRELGPGLLESIYEQCMVHELNLREIAYERQKVIPVVYKGMPLDTGLRIDLLVGGSVVVELKAVNHLDSVHQAQVMTYLRLTGCRLGLLINFNVTQLISGVRRVVLGLKEGNEQL